MCPRGTQALHGSRSEQEGCARPGYLETLALPTAHLAVSKEFTF